MIDAPERAIFAAAFVSLPRVVYLIVLAGHRGWTHSIAPFRRAICSLPSIIRRVRWRTTFEKQNGHVLEVLYSLVMPTCPWTRCCSRILLVPLRKCPLIVLLTPCQCPKQ